MSLLRALPCQPLSLTDSGFLVVFERTDELMVCSVAGGHPGGVLFYATDSCISDPESEALAPPRATMEALDQNGAGPDYRASLIILGEQKGRHNSSDQGEDRT